MAPLCDGSSTLFAVHVGGSKNFHFMNTSSRVLGAFIFNAVACAIASAAPLDALLTANPSAVPGHVEMEVGYDAVNSSLDFLNIREKNKSASNVGDYKGAHVRGGVAVTPDLWLDGALWRRQIDYRSFVAEVNSWQVAGQYKILEGAHYVPSVAVRLGAWGNYADSLTKSTNTSIAGTKFTSATVTKPKDEQYQLDLIGSWQLSPNTEVSMFTGAGTSSVSYDTVSATSRTTNGCEYNVAFNDAGSVSTLAQPCSAPIVVTRYAQPVSATVNANKEARYTASYYQAGAMASWRSNNWRVRGGYQYQTIKRSEIDGIILARGNTPYKNNHILVADVSYKVMSNMFVFVRGQYMKNQFNGEVPMAYNSLTADRFDKRYGIFSAGLGWSF